MYNPCLKLVYYVLILRQFSVFEDTENYFSQQNEVAAHSFRVAAFFCHQVRVLLPDDDLVPDDKNKHAGYTEYPGEQRFKDRNLNAEAENIDDKQHDRTTDAVGNEF